MAASHELATGDEVEGGETNDEESRAHEHVDDETSRVETSEDETTETTDTSASSMSCDYPDKYAETTDPTRPSSDPGDTTTTSASARSMSRDHSDAETTPSRDPVDTADNDTRHPDEPAEPPDDAESTREQGGAERVEVATPETSRGVAFRS